jgi:hypothetical protein
MPHVERSAGAGARQYVGDPALSPTLPAPSRDRDSGLHVRATVRPGGPAAAVRDPASRDLERRLFEALHAGEVDSALLLATTLTYLDPTNDLARRIKLRCVERLRKRDTLELPAPSSVPRRLVGWGSLEGRGLSREAIYLFSLVDGVSTVETLVDASACSPLAAYEALGSLVRLNLVAVR